MRSINLNKYDIHHIKIHMPCKKLITLCLIHLSFRLFERQKCYVVYNRQGGTQPFFFQVGVCDPDFQTVGLVNWSLPQKEGSWELKISKLEAYELKKSKFGGLRAKILAKIEVLLLKMLHFSQKGGLWTDYCSKWEPCEVRERCEESVFRGVHPYTPFLCQFSPPPPPCTCMN